MENRIPNPEDVVKTVAVDDDDACREIDGLKPQLKLQWLRVLFCLLCLPACLT